MLDSFSLRKEMSRHMVDKKDFYKQIHLKVDFGLNGNNQVVQKEIPELVQYDNNSGLLVFDFYHNGRKIDLTETRVIINFKLPSGDGVHDEVTNIRPLESRAMYFTPSGVLHEEGMVEGDVALYRGEVQATSSVRFRFNVIQGINTEGIVDNEKYPILQSLLNQVDEVVQGARDWEQEFQAKNEQMEQTINSSREQFNTQQERFEQQFVSNINSHDARFNEKVNAIDIRFEQKYQEIDEMFHQEDVDSMFQEKFERLEGEYAQDYVDMKQTVREVYSSTLKYRIVE